MNNYYKIMNICDSIALGETKLTSELETLLDDLLYDVACEISDIGDANNIACDTWQELIDGLQDQFLHGERVAL